MTSIPYFSVILARDSVSGAIGHNGSLIWKIKDDIAHFKNTTTNNDHSVKNIVIMGRHTMTGIWSQSLSGLVNRENIVVSTTLNRVTGAIVVPSLKDALLQCTNYSPLAKIFVIGGVALYEEAFNHPHLECIYETVVYDHINSEADRFFTDPIPHNFSTTITSECDTQTSHCIFKLHTRLRVTSECAYIKLMRDILADGEYRHDRTLVGTQSLFARDLVFDLRDGFPLLTTKRVNLRIVFEELIWMLRGQTNNNTLVRKRVHIWSGNARSHHDRMIVADPHYPRGEMGPLYGFSWRSFGGIYPVGYIPVDCSEDTRVAIEDTRHIAVNGGYDQIAAAIHLIKTDPTSRRILISGWNPLVLDDIALPACHYTCQFYVSCSRYLNCRVGLRSSDVFLGLPFNIAQYSLLTIMMAAMTGLDPGTLTIGLGDAHIYLTHIEQCHLQISRPVRSLPTLIVRDIPAVIEDFEFTNFELQNYNPHPTITGVMAV